MIEILLQLGNVNDVGSGGRRTRHAASEYGQRRDEGK
jgi:hypothetical protein